MRPGGVQAVQGLLAEGFRARLWRGECEWLHPQFEAHVRPTLLAHYSAAKRGLGPRDRCMPDPVLWNTVLPCTPNLSTCKLLF